MTPQCDRQTGWYSAICWHFVFAVSFFVPFAQCPPTVWSCADTMSGSTEGNPPTASTWILWGNSATKSLLLLFSVEIIDQIIVITKWWPAGMCTYSPERFEQPTVLWCLILLRASQQAIKWYSIKMKQKWCIRRSCLWQHCADHSAAHWQQRLHLNNAAH